jgi:hypothetical protein
MPRGDVPWYILQHPPHSPRGYELRKYGGERPREGSSVGDVKRVAKDGGARRESLPLEVFVSSAPEQWNVELYFAKYLLWEFEKFTPYSRCVDVGDFRAYLDLMSIE